MAANANAAAARLRPRRTIAYRKRMHNCAVWLDQLHANYTLRCLLFIQVIFTIKNALPQLLRRNLFSAVISF
jgi:hypothetical protein